MRAVGGDRCLALLDGDGECDLAQLVRELGLALRLEPRMIIVRNGTPEAAVVVEDALVDLGQAVEDRRSRPRMPEIISPRWRIT